MNENPNSKKAFTNEDAALLLKKASGDGMPMASMKTEKKPEEDIDSMMYAGGEVQAYFSFEGDILRIHVCAACLPCPGKLRHNTGIWWQIVDENEKVIREGYTDSKGFSTVALPPDINSLRFKFTGEVTSDAEIKKRAAEFAIDQAHHEDEVAQETQRFQETFKRILEDLNIDQTIVFTPQNKKMYDQIMGRDYSALFNDFLKTNPSESKVEKEDAACRFLDSMAKLHYDFIQMSEQRIAMTDLSKAAALIQKYIEEHELNRGNCCSDFFLEALKGDFESDAEELASDLEGEDCTRRETIKELLERFSRINYFVGPGQLHDEVMEIGETLLSKKTYLLRIAADEIYKLAGFTMPMEQRSDWEELEREHENEMRRFKTGEH